LHIIQGIAMEHPHAQTGNVIPARNTNAMIAAAASPLEVRLLQAALDQVDYGLAVVDVDSPALALLGDTHASDNYRLQAGRLEARHHDAQELLHLALQATKVGRRKLLPLHGTGSVAAEARAADSVAVLPLATPGYALLAFSRQQVCDATSVTLFARECGLTGAEGQVLAKICKGLSPQQIATDLGVQISTIRTQLRAIRQKTATDSLRQLVEMASRLPPAAVRLAAFC
jgi:DNA-binding CsgD family transcriptional regulator